MTVHTNSAILAKFALYTSMTYSAVSPHAHL
nr:MAG TPA: hypothetical protein [Caudoviricetes sp.]